MAYRTAKSGEIITLSQHEDAMMHPVLSQALHHWEALCEAQTPPSRCAIDARDLSGLLSNIFILERSRPGTVRMRLGGMHLADLMGMEVRGLPMRAFFELSERTRLMSDLEQVFSRPAKLMLHLASDMQGQTPLEGQMLILPLKGPTDDIDRAFGVITTQGPLGLRPRRFRIKRSNISPLFADIAANSPARQNPKPPRLEGGRPHLTLINGRLDQA